MCSMHIFVVLPKPCLDVLAIVVQRVPRLKDIANILAPFFAIEDGNPHRSRLDRRAQSLPNIASGVSRPVRSRVEKQADLLTQGIFMKPGHCIQEVNITPLVAADFREELFLLGEQRVSSDHDRTSFSLSGKSYHWSMRANAYFYDIFHLKILFRIFCDIILEVFVFFVKRKKLS